MVLVAQDSELSIRFSVGKKLVILCLKMVRGQDVEEVVSEIMSREDLPLYLRLPLIRTIRDSSSSDPLLSLASLQESLEGLASNVRVTGRRGGDKEEGKEREEFVREYMGIVNSKEVVGVVRAGKERRVSMLGGALGGGALMVMDSLSPEDPKDDRLPLPDLLLEALDAFSLRLALLRQTNLDAMDELQARQSDEMEKAIADMVNVADLVGKHIAEVDALETSFRLKTRSLLSSQRAKMREYVSMLASSAPPYLEFSSFDPSSTPSSSSSEDLSTQGRSGSKWSRRWFRLRPSDDDSPSPSEKEKSGVKEREGKGMEAVMTVSVGVFRPVLFQITLRTCPLSWSSSLPVQDKKAALSSMRMIYGDSLSAAVMLYDRKLSTSSSAYKQFTAMLAQRPELHFEEFSEQIPEGEMEAGDVFVTRHSNVPSLHIVFHIVIDQPLQPLSDSALSLDTDPRSIQGFRNLLAVSAHYDIASLSFPLLLLPPDALSDQHLSHPSCVARSIGVIYALKMMLQGGSLNNLKELNLQLPKVSNEMFQKYRAAVKNVFNLQIGC